MYNESKGIKEFSKKYFSYLFELLNQLEETEIDAFAEELESARRDGNTIFIAGNGGSAATASHMANDFGGDISKKTGTNKPFRAFALTDNGPLIMAIGNDDGYENVFVNQLRIHYREGDKLLAISASGNSANLVNAAEWIKNRGGKVISLVGFDGGKLKDVSDVSIHAKTGKGEYGPVEDIHMIMDHLLANWFQYKIQQEESSK